ncbi:hypothetical protein [Myxosarcina sp. GI1]|uniref:hypothetical protein n=1 Tax=Myxosarcina sp. GI1 TaxID=1541065 RepID=UPI00055C2D64|nr:hypothetical protein [Myxosarcina sp. GI1]
MAKISIYLDELKLKHLDDLVDSNPHLTKRSRSSLLGYLIEQEVAKETKRKMIEAAQTIDELDLGWNEDEEECAIIDLKVSG